MVDSTSTERPGRTVGLRLRASAPHPAKQGKGGKPSTLHTP